MQLIGTHQILCLLADLALHGRQQLRRDRRIQNILQHVVKRLVLFRVVPGQISHQMTHQRLWNGAVHGIHAHVVAVIRAPAQGQLAEIPGADDNAAALVGNVHQNLGPLPGLAIFKGDGVIVHVVADILEMAADRGGDIHRAQRGPQLLRQDHGIVAGAVRGAEARHGDGDDIRHGPVQHFHGKTRDQHGQRGIQPAGKSHHSRFGAGMLQPLLEPKRGNEQDLPAALIPVGLSLRHKGPWRDIAGELRFGNRQRKGHAAVGCPAGHRLGAAALIAELLHIDLAEQKPSVKSPLRQKAAVFRNHLVGAKYHVGGGFPLAGTGINIAAQKLCRLHSHQLAAVGILADEIIAGGEVADDGGTRLGHAHRRGVRRPQILADLKAQHQAGHGLAGEHLLRGKGRLLSAQADPAALFGSGGELAFFVKLSVIWQVGLWNHAQNLSFLYNNSAVIQIVVDLHRHSHRCHHLQISGGRQHGGKGLLRAPQQSVLIKKVAAGIARQSQFRQHQHLGARLVGGAHHGEGLLGVVIAVRQAQSRRAAGNRNQTVFHRYDHSFPLRSKAPKVMKHGCH